MAADLTNAGLSYLREHRFAPPRRWRFDFVLSGKLAVEVEGGHWSGGRHVRGAGFEADCEKYAAAVVQGWRVLRVTRRHIESGQAVAWVKEAMRT